MASSHHGDGRRPSPEQQKLMQQFINQVEGRAARTYSQGRLGADDDGQLAMAIAADTKKRVVVIDFGKPVTWLGLPPKEVNGLINMLKQKLAELGEPCVIEA